MGLFKQFKCRKKEPFPHWCMRAHHFIRLTIILDMARGWESKSVEEQQAEAASVPVEHRKALSPAQLAAERRKQGLTLSRQRVLQQIEAAQNPNHRKMLESALADLDAQLARLG